MLDGVSEADESPVVAHIQKVIAEVEGKPCPLDEAERVFNCLSVMPEKRAPLLFDQATRLWRGRNHGK